MGRSVNVSGKDSKDSKGGGFDPLPAGIYNVTIYDHEVKQYGQNTANKGRDFIALQLRVSEPQKGANRRLFTNVGDFPRWAPKDGASEGKVNFQFFQFYKALGVEFPEGADGDVDLPDYEDLNGSSLAVKITIANDDYRYKQALKEWKALPKKEQEKVDEPQPGDFLRNEVKEFLPEQDLDDLADDMDSGDDDEDFDF